MKQSPVPILQEARALASATPVMAQYFQAKVAHPTALVFFRMGDFYELFFEDARQAAPALGIALTHRGTHDGEPIAMAGVPVHAADGYLAKLIRAGFKVAVCEQVESPGEARKRAGKTLVRREVVRVVTAGTLTEDALLEARGTNRLAAVAVRAGRGAVACVDISTGEVECMEVGLEGFAAALAALRPSEVLITDRLLAQGDLAGVLASLDVVVEPLPGAVAEPSAAQSRLQRLYGTQTLDAFGDFIGAEIAALGLIAAYLETTQAGRLPVLRPPQRGGQSEVMTIDPATRASLEIERTYAGAREGALLFAIDRTVSAAGGRLLASRLGRPLTSRAAIEARLDGVEWLVERGELRLAVRQALKGGGDMARALSRLALGRGGPRDLACLRDGLAVGSAIAALFEGHGRDVDQPPELIAAALGAVSPRRQRDIGSLLEVFNAGLSPSPPVYARDGGFVASGYCVQLDEARGLRDDSRRVIAPLEARLADQTGLPLKIRHNAVLGYFVETNARQAAALFQEPLSRLFIHRQTLANQVRFTTAELSELDGKIAQAAEQALAIEVSVFESWAKQAAESAPAIHAAIDALAMLDVAAAGAQWAEESNAVRPVVEASSAFEARAARHPVVEWAVRRQGNAYTANDCVLDGAGERAPRLSLVSGPNMAGKSTFLRQNALLCVLAQAGFFLVPAKSLTLGVVDRLFSRVGAADDLARGRSTFMAEMVETAAILNQATPSSFVILDEIGRGTSTWDGLAIAWACVEALHDGNRCRTLFATHYHELAALEGRLAMVSNLSMRAKEWNGELVFLHEAAPGAADRSYGVQVARLAGVPAGVVARAREVLARLEQKGDSHAGLEELPLFAAALQPPAPPSPGRVDAAISKLDLDGMSPREAMETLYRLKALLA